MGETFVLLHGSWHGGWAWEPTAWCLRELGHTVYTPTYPGHWPGANRAGITHDDYVKGVTDFIEQRDLRDVVLVGHSFGGSVVSRVSQEIPGRLKRLVFHTAFVVEDGASVNDNFPPEELRRGRGGPGAARGHVASGHVVPAGPVQDRAHVRQPRGDVHPARRTGPHPHRSRPRLRPSISWSSPPPVTITSKSKAI